MTDDPGRFLLLVVRYFDGDLDEAETAELNALLRSDPECRRLFAEYGTQSCLIAETLGAEREQPRPEPSAVEPDIRETRPSRRIGRRRLLIAAGVAGLAVAALVLWWPSEPPQPVRVALGIVEPTDGEVRVTGADGQIRVVAAREEIRSGDTVRTEGLRGTAAVIYPDGTRLTLVGDTTVTCTDPGRKTVRIHLGTVVASVRPQPAGSPMVVDTPTARVEVRGTEFTCQVTAERTEVSVTRGLVRVIRTGEGQSVEVPEGKRVLAGGQVGLAVEPVLGLPDTWDMDFENGLSADFRRGRFVTDGLPRGSKGGVAAVRSTQRGAEGFFEIGTPDMWHRGLFVFHPDSHLHVTYKMDRPDWVNVFVMARAADPNGPHVGNYLFNDGSFYAQLRPGQWRTVSIPLSAMRRAGTRHDAPPAADEVPYMVLLSSQGDRGLVIDRVWVTRGGPGVVRYADVE